MPSESSATQLPQSPVPAARYVLFAAIAVGGCAVDLLTKLLAWRHLEYGEIRWLWNQHAGFQLSLNEGALFGMGQGMVMWFAALSVVALIGIPWWLFRYRVAHDLVTTIALGCVTGGILGNLYDRLGLHGLRWPPHAEHAGERIYAVRDWILWQWDAEWRWPNFNLADSLLVLGTALLMYRALKPVTQVEEHSIEA